MHRLTVFALLLAVALPASAASIVITKTGGEKIPVDISGLQTAGGGAAIAVKNTLSTDISRSGWLSLASSPAAASARLRGQITDNGQTVSFACVVTDALGNTLVNGNYTLESPKAIYLGHQVASDLVLKLAGQPSFFLHKLVLVGVSGNAKELYVADSSFKDVRQLTQDRSIAVKPRWSPDNRLVSYTSYLHRYPDVYTIDLSTGTRQRVAAFPGVNSGGAISPDGRSMALVLSKDGNPDLYVMDLSSRRTTRLTNTPRATEGSPSWSPDGSRIVYVSDASGTPQLYVIPRSGGTPSRVSLYGSQNVAPDWGKNGLIACQSLQGGKFQIAVIDPANPSAQKVVSDFAAAYEDPSWAPDGRHIAAARSVNYAYSICLLDTMGDKPVLLTNAGDWRAPSWQH